MKPTRSILWFAALAFTALTATAQSSSMAAPEREKTAAEKRADFDQWLAKAGPRIVKRNEMINAIVRKMAPELARLPAGATNATTLAHALHGLSDAQLQAAMGLTKLTDVDAAINGAPAAAEQGRESAKGALGDDINLVFTPIEPCRIADSRYSSQGKLAAGSTRTYWNYGASGQGGTSTCNNAFGSAGIKKGSLGALALNVTATGAESPGHLRLSPYNVSSISSVLNYMPGVDIANSTVVKTAGLGIGQPDFQIYTVARTDVVIDLLGFYLPSEPAALDCTTTGPTTATMTGSFSNKILYGPVCPAGYTKVMSTCSADSQPAWLQSVGDSGCMWSGSNTATLQAYSRCCRVPGTSAPRF